MARVAASVLPGCRNEDSVCCCCVVILYLYTFFPAQHRRNGRCECFWIFCKSTWKFITISHCVHVATRKKAWKRVGNFSYFPLQWVEFKKCTHNSILEVVHVFVGGLWGTIHCVKHRQSPQHPRKSVGESNFVCIEKREMETTIIQARERTAQQQRT